jgi:LysM repeat protein
MRKFTRDALASPMNLPARVGDAKMPAMKSLVFQLSVTLFAAALCAGASGQTLAGNDKANAQLETLTRKIDEQNTKIDALSQQLLKLEQQLSTIRPGIMIGEATPAPATAASIPVTAPAIGNAHVVTKGETLTSIAKANKVGVQELQKFNHIENDRALQIGQTIMIPHAGVASPPASPNPTTPND